MSDFIRRKIVDRTRRRVFLSTSGKKSLTTKILLGVAGFFGVLAIMMWMVWEFPLFGRFIYPDLPDLDNLESLSFDETSVILDRNGQELYRIFADQNRKYVPLSEISPNIINATIAIEDKDFFKHSGVDFVGIIRATVMNFLHRGGQQGASTITQQLVRNLWPDIISPYEKTINRKLKEALMSHYIEQKYDKNKIIELYLNKVSYVSNTYGVEQAAQNIFGVAAKDLTIAQSAVLASLYKSPTTYSPYRSDRSLLMGKCSGQEESNQAEAQTQVGLNIDKMTIKIKAPKRVWFKITTDGDTNTTDESILETGEEATFVATNYADISFGNLDAQLTVNDLPLKKLTAKKITINKKELATLVTDPAALANLESAASVQVQAGHCTGLDDPNYEWGRKDYVLNLMVENGMITKEQRDQAWKDANKLVFKVPKEKILFPHFIFYVKDELERMYGKEIVARGGLTVKTTIDPELQKKAEELVNKYALYNTKRYEATNAALVAIDNRTGDILAMVGSRDYYDTEHDGNVNVVTSYRQPGSSFKPFIYSAMMSNPGHGYGAGSVIYDVETSFGDGPPPQNYEGGFKGPMTVRNALSNSRNIPAIKAFFLAASENQEDVILDFVEKLGFTYLKENKQALAQKYGSYNYGWPMALGTAEVRLIDMAGGYTVFANGGYRKAPNPFLEIRNSAQSILYKEPTEVTGKKVLDEQIAYIITSILSDVNARPAGMWRNNLTLGKYPAAVKTGTSNKRLNKYVIRPSNTLTIGFTPYITVGVWAGNNNGDVMSPSADGLNVAAPLWKDFMLQAHEILKLDPAKAVFNRPAGVTDVVVSRLSGKIAGKSTPKEYLVKDIFPSFNLPTEYDNSVTLVQVDKRNNFLAGEQCPPDVIESKAVLNVHDIAPFPKWEKAVQAWAVGYSRSVNNLLPNIPKTESPLCVPVAEGQAPLINIVSPQAYGVVGKGKLNVVVDTSAFFGEERVDYYINGEKISTNNTRPFTGYLSIPANIADGTELNIRAVLTDKNYNQAEASVVVKTSSSVQSEPIIKIISPTQGEEVITGSSVDVKVEAYDPAGAIEQVDLSYDGSAVGSKKSEPYIFKVKPTAGAHLLTATATNSAGKKISASVNFQAVAGESSSVSLYGTITAPRSGQTFAAGESVKVVAEIPTTAVDQLSAVTVYHRNLNNNQSEEIYHNSDVNTSYFVTYFEPSVGKHELYIKTIAKNGASEISAKVVFEVK